jgi:hypothetical protein
MSLARLVRSTAPRADARAMLAKIYGWFTEGFDTPVLNEAKTLLNDLSSKSGDRRRSDKSRKNP